MTHTHRHEYRVRTVWHDQGTTRDYRSYSRDHVVELEGKPPIAGSADPAFRGDAARHNPEDLLVASLSTCHMLWYLHLCAVGGVVVVDYYDEAVGVMEETADGGGRFVEVVLRPTATITASSPNDKALELHHPAHEKCFIASSVNFPVRCEPNVVPEP